jgi:phage-related protein
MFRKMSVTDKPEFSIRLLQEADEFIKNLDNKSRQHIYLKLRKAQFENNPRKFSKVRGVIWEFRIPYKNVTFRFYSFWCKKENSLVIATHGIMKKTRKAPKKEIDKAEQIMKRYYEKFD